MSDCKTIKIGTFGGRGCGKTLITLRYLKNEFDEGYIPMIEDEFSKVIEIDNQCVNISMLNTAGQDDFAEMRFSYYSQVQGFILVFDITNPQSIDDIKNIYRDIEDTVDTDDICCVIAANKADLRNENRTDLIPISEYKIIEEYFHCKVIETSSKTGQNINSLFEYLIHLVLSKQQKNKKPTSTPQLDSKEASLKSQNQRIDRKRSPVIWTKPPSKPKKQNEEPSYSDSKSGSQPESQEKINQVNQEIHLKTIDELATLLEKQKKETEAANQKIKEMQQIIDQKSKEIESKTDLLHKAEQKNKELESQLKQQSDKLKEIELKYKISSKSSVKILMHKKEIRIIDVAEIDKMNQVEKIGHGSTSEVIKVICNQPYALKVFDDEIVKNDKSDGDDENELNSKLKQLMKEYEILNQIEHPNIVKTFGICLGDKCHKPSILYEFFPQNLNAIVSALKNSEQVLIIFEIGEVMKHVHHLGIVHRDLKPSNIFIDSNKHAKLSDFGISAMIKVDSEAMSRTKVQGSYEFMAPELIRCQTDYDEKVDVYSFGVVVYFVLTGGELPKLSLSDAEKGTLPAFPDKINEFSKDLISRCMAANSKERPSFDEIVESIEQNNFKLIDGIDQSSFEFQFLS